MSKPTEDGLYLVSWKGQGLVNPIVVWYHQYSHNTEYCEIVNVFGCEDEFTVNMFEWHGKIEIQELSK